MDEAQKALENEVDIVKMVRSIRLMQLALSNLLKPEIYKELEQKSHFIASNRP